MRVNLAIQIPAEAVTDSIILCVLCMATNKVEAPMWKHVQESVFQAPLRSLQWLDIYGRLSPHLIHQAGLVQLINLRGGLERIELPGLAAIIAYSSVLGASRSLSRPSFPYISVQTGGHLILQDIINPHTERFSSPHIPPEMQDIFRAQLTYVTEIEMYEDGIPISRDVLCDHRNLIQWHIMSLIPSGQLGSSHSGLYPLYEASRLALIIFGVGVSFPLPPQSAPLVTLARMLKLELQSYHRSVQEIPISAVSLYTWILMLGCIAATGSAERKWYINSMGAHVVFYGPITWYEFKIELKSILWLERACDQPGELVWNEVMCL
ncbi:hypothetical protein N7532_011716 [Penicillium argentinense]|uniref:Uncharacterized protein n=1 Tax=Penicillium argentinense TaxID=1131581 RepID=A0A9W9EIY8_9EURO|nr:uncharacterized protein N7532_011716 [Penicillium argentinense]KAJ5082673.1 hypothetical protein N7532_011716 [Penicillium argentinense]